MIKKLSIAVLSLTVVAMVSCGGKSLVDVSVVKEALEITLGNNTDQTLFVRAYSVEGSRKSSKKSLVALGDIKRIGAAKTQDVEVSASAQAVIISAPEEVMLTERITEPSKLSIVQVGDASQGLGIVWMAESANLQ